MDEKNTGLVRMPVIMQTGADKPAQIKEGIDAGVFYYLTKPLEEGVLKSVLTAAVREARHQKALNREMKRHDTSFHLMDNSKYALHTLEEAEDLSCFLANCFPNSENTLSGLAEILINAVEHGNFEISYDEKTKLIEKGIWRKELKKK